MLTYLPLKLGRIQRKKPKTEWPLLNQNIAAISVFETFGPQRRRIGME